MFLLRSNLPDIKIRHGEFRYITTEITKVTAIAYSENRMADIGSVPRKLVWMLTFAFLLSISALITLHLSLNQNYPGLEPTAGFFAVIAGMLAAAAGIAVAVMVMNFTEKDLHLPTYKERLTLYLQNYFDEINASVFRKRGLLWKLGKHCKWIELHIMKLTNTDKDVILING